MATLTTHLDLAPELVTDIFSKVKGHSALASLCGADPIPFNGIEVMTFSMDGEAELVGEGDTKSPGEAAFGSVTINPFKLVYQHRLTDEFIRMSDEKRLPYLQAFGDGFAKKIARAVDITGFHGLNPKTGAVANSIRSKSFDIMVENTITYDATTPDDNIEAAIAQIHAADGEITGIAMAPAFGAAMATVKVNGVAIIGDFQNAFKWGYAANLPLEVIEYGDPDGLGDLKRKNQIVLRAEAYIGFGILDAASFSRIITE